MEVKKALFIQQEIAPYLDETTMSLWGRDLPQGIKERGAEVRAFMPKYGCINERRNQLHEVQRLTGMNIIIDDTDHPLLMKTASLPTSRISVFFIFNDDYFINPKDKEIKEPPREPETILFADNNHERTIFYVRSVIEALRKQRWSPNVIQCSGWMSALAPLYMRELFPDDPSFREAKIVCELWDDEFPQPLNERLATLLQQDGISEQAVSDIAGKPVDHTALMLLAIKHCDAVIQRSPDIDPELIEAVTESGKPFLPYADMGDNHVDAVANFYESL